MTEERPQTLGEEIANSVSHGVALLAALVGAPFLLVSASQLSVTNIVGAAVFAATMVLLYFTSTLYHALPAGRAKRVFLKLDHGAIYLFIAGSYTPFALGALGGPWGWTLFGLVWAAAVLGVAAKLFNRLRHPLWSTGLYVAMGWVALVAAAPLLQRMSGTGLAWLVAGGVAYTLGAIVFLFDNRVRYAHFVWHLFVMAGTACHVCAAFWQSA